MALTLSNLAVTISAVPAAVAAAVWDKDIDTMLTANSIGSFLRATFNGAVTRVKMYLAQLNILTTGADNGLDINATNGIGINVESVGHGVKIISYGNNVSGIDIGKAHAPGINFTGINIVGDGTGPAMKLTGGGAAAGLHAIGGSTQGPGAKFEAGSDGDGLELVGLAAGHHDLSAANNNLGILTDQDTRDAMKLAPSWGAPAAGSVDNHLDEMKVAVVDPMPELTTTPSATPTLRQAIMLMYMKWRNKNKFSKNTNTTGKDEIFNDAGVAITKKTFSDSGSVTTVDKMIDA
jgi:hypothetical protein